MKKTITRILAFVAALVCGGAWGDCVMALECGIIRAICRAEELMADWNLAANHGEVFKIRGLDER